MININDLPKTGGVYKIISPNNKIYIGKTKNIRQRFFKYSRLLCKQQKKLYNSFLKYGFQNHNIEILIFTDDNKKLIENEIFYIQNYETYNSEKGLNLTKGGDGRTTNHSDITKLKISEGLKNSEKFKKTMNSLEYKEKLSKSLMNHPGYGKGKKRSQEIVEKIKLGVKIRNEKFGTRKHTEECKLKMSKKRKGGNNANSKKSFIKYKNELIKFECQKFIKDYINNINEKLNLKGKDKYSYYGLINKGFTKDIILFRE